MKLLNVRELADRLGVSTDWVYTQVEAQAIPHIRLPGAGGKGRLIRFSEDHVRAILAACERPAERPAVTPPRTAGRRPAVRPVVHLTEARTAARQRRAAELARRSA